MIWFLIPVVIAFFIGVWYAIDTRHFMGIVWMTLGGAVVGIILGMFPNMIIASNTDFKYETVATHKIQAIQDTGSINGRFFLGSGSIDEDPVFWYYQDHGDYSTLEDVWAAWSHIVQSDDVAPQVEVQRAVSPNDWWVVTWDEPARYVFTVPTGSIMNNFNLDAKP